MRVAKVGIYTLSVLCVLAAATVGYRHYLITELRRPILAELSDPDSALFRDERYIGNWTVSGGLLCGEVNAKNRMGGYTGYRSFSTFYEFVTLHPDDVSAKVGKKTSTECEEVLATGNPWWWLTR